jgi:hypothetical protein
MSLGPFSPATNSYPPPPQTLPKYTKLPAASASVPNNGLYRPIKSPQPGSPHSSSMFGYARSPDNSNASLFAPRNLSPVPSQSPLWTAPKGFSNVPKSPPTALFSESKGQKSPEIDLKNKREPEDKSRFKLIISKVGTEDNRTTLMIKNIPNKYNQKMLLAAVDERHKGTYDFFYLPIDFKVTSCSLY